MSAKQDSEMLALALRQHGAFSRAQAKQRNFTHHQIRYKLDQGLWLPRAPRVYALPQFEQSFEQRAMVAHLHCGSGSFLSHRCAARLRHLDGVRTAGVEISTPRHVRSLKGVRIHVVSDATDEDWTLVGALPVATTTRVLVDLAVARASLNTLERVYECGVRRDDTDLATLVAVADRVSRRGKRTQRLHELTARLVRDGKRNGSDAETLFFQILRDADLPLPTRQRQMLREDGSFAYNDYAYDGIDAVLEVLGYSSHSKRAALDSDAERNNDINLEGKTLLEFTWTHLTEDREYIVRTVTRLLRRHGRV